MTARTAIIVVSYNRPKLVRDCLLSIIEQHDHDWFCYVMDDGSNEETRFAILETILRSGHTAQFHVRFGPTATVAERRAFLRYSHQINIALTDIVKRQIAMYACSVCDDDYLYPEAIGARADYLDAHPETSVVYGRLRSIVAGSWSVARPPRPGRSYVYPSGVRISRPTGMVFDWPYDLDPATWAPVDEGFWQAEPMVFGKPHRVDHNQVMWRMTALPTAPIREDPERFEFWPEARLLTFPDEAFFLRYEEIVGRSADEVRPWCSALARGAMMGDAEFFQSLANQGHLFHSIPEWIVTKRYHIYCDGYVTNHPVVRE